jgi:ketosteroid isomerase-like protein
MAGLRRWVLALVLASGIAAASAEPPQSATDIGAGDRGIIQRVISDQMAAFRRDDAAAAFGFAAPGIQDMFGTPERFLQMVRDGYQAVYRPSEVRFAELVRIDGKLTQLVHVVGPDGVPRTALYFMERQPDGSWRIGGCVLTVEPGTTT